MGFQVSALVLVLLCALVAPRVASQDSDATCVAASKAYVRALLTHDSSPVPLHPRCTRVENGIPSGLSGPEIAFSLDTFPGFRVIKAIRDETYVVQNGIVISNYILEVGVLFLTSDVPVQENFTCLIYNGVQTLRTIVAVYSLVP